MATNLFGATTIPLLEQVVNFSAGRHNVLAGNIANMDTPGYHAQDLSPARFEAQLKQAVETQHSQPAPSIWSGAAQPASPADEPSQSDPWEALRDTMHSLTYLDESDVDMERQVSEMTKNQAQYNLALGIMTSQFHLLQAAISGNA